ncbi:hypothetical protein IAR50_004643 [Cryptococcus sp. DSM 104548]
MALASSSSTMLKSAKGVSLKCLTSQARTYATPAAATSAPYSPPPQSYSSASTSTTPEAAQSYLTNLLSLPPSRQFSPSLALQILTHKSYRFSHPVRSISPEDPSAILESSAPHNSRLAFLGRRALTTYLALFVHEQFAGSSGKLREQGGDFLRGKDLDQRLANLRHPSNLGRVLGGEWGLEDVMRWDKNITGHATHYASIKGQAVEAVLGGIFTQFGSPAAHRAFHLHVLPKVASQLRDPFMVEKAQSVREELEKEFGRGILPKQ